MSPKLPFGIGQSGKAYRNEITKGQLLALHVGKNKDNGTLKHTQVSMIKRNNVDGLTITDTGNTAIAIDGHHLPMVADIHGTNLHTVKMIPSKYPSDSHAHCKNSQKFIT